MALSVAQVRRQVSDRVGSAYLWPKLPWIIIGFGILIRLARYVQSGSLTLDEAVLGLSIAGGPFAELLNPLDSPTGAPIGFLAIEKLAVRTLGNNEFALRLFPLLAGIGSLLLFYIVAKHYLVPRAVPLALAIFAASTPLIQYSGFVKQYSSDVFITLLMILLTTQVVRSGLSARWLILYAVAGAVLVWFSHPLPLVLAGFGATLGLSSLIKREWRAVIWVSMVSVIWLVSFLSSFFFTPTAELLTVTGITAEVATANGFFPSQPFSLAGARWFTTNMFQLFIHPVGLDLVGLAFLTFVLGLLAFHSKDSLNFLILVSPLVITIIVSAAHLYPLFHRWALFLVPFAILFVAEGATTVAERTKHAYPVLGGLIIGLLLLHPLASESFRLFTSGSNEEIRPVLRYLSHHRTDNDVVYVYYAAFSAFSYYADRYGFEDADYIHGVLGLTDDNSQRDLNKFLADIDKLRGSSRVWVVFSHSRSVPARLDIPGTLNEEQLFILNLDRAGTQKDVFRSAGAAVYLYDLSTAPDAPVQTPPP